MSKKIEHTGEKIRKYRIAQGLTQKELGQKCNMYESQIRKYETGKANPKRQTLLKIATALNIPINQLYSDLEIELNGINALINKIVDSEMEKLTKDINKLEQIQNSFSQLNSIGQDKAIEQMELLTKIPEYQKKDE